MLASEATFDARLERRTPSHGMMTASGKVVSHYEASSIDPRARRGPAHRQPSGRGCVCPGFHSRPRLLLDRGHAAEGLVLRLGPGGPRCRRRRGGAVRLLPSRVDTGGCRVERVNTDRYRQHGDCALLTGSQRRRDAPRASSGRRAGQAPPSPTRLPVGLCLSDLDDPSNESSAGMLRPDRKGHEQWTLYAGSPPSA
jgi:hypothetical protein